MKIQIGNVNINNHSLLKDAAAVSGYAASIELVNETTRVIDLGDDDFREEAGVTDAEVDLMISLIIFRGFSIQRI